MRLDNNKYKLKTYLINKQITLVGRLNECVDDTEKVKYLAQLEIIRDVIKICDERNRY